MGANICALLLSGMKHKKGIRTLKLDTLHHYYMSKLTAKYNNNKNNYLGSAMNVGGV